ncbi:MAG: pilus assembly protein TadG-related protein [Nitratireductor sp.]
MTQSFKFFRATGGNFAVTLGLIAPVLMGCIGLAIDYSIYSSQQWKMQDAADSAALAAIKEAPLSNWNEESARIVAEEQISHALGSAFTSGEYTYTVTPDVEQRLVRVNLEQRGHGYFLMGMFKSDPQIGVTAIARSAGSQAVCVISLEASQKNGLEVADQSALNASDCSVHSNSSHPKSIKMSKLAAISAPLTCVGGGVDGPDTNIVPSAITDCPAANDPLAGRNPVSTGSCMPKLGDIKGEKATLSPGTYCDDIKIDKQADVTLLPGVYSFQGKFEVKGDSSLSGIGVTLQFLGKNAKLKFDHDSKIALSAPDTGQSAGIVLMADKAIGKTRKFEINSKDANKLVGAVYFPFDDLVIGGDEDGDGTCDFQGVGIPMQPTQSDPLCDANVGDNSEWTAIVARKIKLNHNVQVHIKADYKASEVPVPSGLADWNQRSYLAK